MGRPFTVIGGFLGAGKTTLVNQILAQADGTRYAVLVNDFGAINIDEALIASHDGQTMALTNGCICCSLADGFVATMLRLMEDPGAFDHVIVEASGVAQPSRIMDFARLDPELAEDATITLVDAETFPARLADPLIADAVAAQVSHADIIVVNRTDLASAEAMADTVACVAALNPRAPRLVCSQADVPVHVILDTGQSGTSGAEAADVAFQTQTYRRNGPVDRTRFEAWAGALPDGVLRGKGFVRFTGEDRAHLWQRVGVRSSLAATREDRQTELVLISSGDLPGEGPG